MRQVIRDYFTAYRAGRWRAAKNGTLLLVYSLTLMPCMMQIFSRGMREIISFYVTALVAVYAVYAAPLHPVTLPKLMYLCPMDAAARRAYITKAYLFKVLFPIGLTVIAMGALIAFGEVNMGYGVCVLFAVAGSSVCTSLFRAERIAACIGKNQSVFDAGTDGWENLAVAVTTFISLFILFFFTEDEDFEGIICGVVLVCMAVLELPLTIMMMRRIRPALDAAVWYE